MSNKPNKRRVGLFLVIGCVCLFGLIGKFVIARLMPDNENFVVMFFEESIKGLHVGSPVSLEGVEIGKVTRISLETDPSTLKYSVPVYVQLNKKERKAFAVKSIFMRKKSREAILKELIDKGLRARLATQNFLTGQLMIELVMAPDTPINYTQTPETEDVFQIPTTLSTISELSKGFQDLPLRTIISRLNNILSTLERDLPTIVTEFHQVGVKMNELLPTLTQVAARTNKTLTRIDSQVPQVSQTMNQLNYTLTDISGAAKSLRNLTDYLERHPEAVLKGKGK